MSGLIRFAGKRRGAAVCAVSVGFTVLCGCTVGELHAPQPTATVTVTAPPQPGQQRTTPSQAPTKPKSTTPAKPRGSSAVFEHFKVTVSQVRRGAGEVRVHAKVCVRKPLDRQVARTRVSWDPWSIRAASETVDAEGSGTAPFGEFPAEDMLRAGECASGWIPFPADVGATKVKYVNGLGDVAVWNAKRLDRKPTTRHKTTVAPPEKEKTTESEPEQEEQSRAKSYSNCAALNEDYPHGVGRRGAEDQVTGSTDEVTNFKRSDRLYEANAGRDRDRDGIACERL